MGKGKCAVCGAVYFTSGGEAPAGCTGAADTCVHSPRRKKTGRVTSIGKKRDDFNGNGVKGTK